MAIARQRRPPRPTELLLALRGSGQALYVGLAEDAFVVASEPYGAGRGDRHLPAHGRRDAGRPDAAAASRGQVVVLDARPGRHARGHRAASPTTAPTLPVADDELADAPRSPPATSTAATSRTSCSRRSREAPASFRKTLRGKIVERRRPARRARSATETLPDDVRGAAARRRASAGSLVIGQGTAAVAGQSLAAVLDARWRRRPRCASRPSLATELSGLRAARRHVRHARRRHQPERHHHRHQPHRRPGPRPRRGA